MTRLRLLTYLLVTSGPILVWAADHFQIKHIYVKALGLLLNAPGVVLVTGLSSFGASRTLLGSVACWLLTLACLEPLLRWIEKPAQRQPDSPKAQVKVTRRTFLVASTGVASAAAVASYGFLYELRNLQLEQFTLTLPDLPPELEGLRVVLMSDWHCGPVNRPYHLGPAIDLANRCRPDLVLIPGDFTSRSGRYFVEAAELASRLRPKVAGGVLLSWGNHDYWHGIEPGLDLMPKAGCQILTNQSLVLTRSRGLARSGEGLWLCGLDDLWAGTPKLVATLASIPANQPRLVLSHNPDVAEEQFGARVDLMLSGHTHGGQVRIPTLGTPILPSRYGQKYASGLVQAPEYPVYVSRGVGSSGLPVRFGVPPEVTLFQLTSGSSVSLNRSKLT